MGRSTRLPVLLPEIDAQRFDCHGCARCCRELVVQLTSSDRRRLDEQGWATKLGTAPYVRLGRRHVLNHRGGACVFLQDDGTCRLHAESGPAAKPLACRLYPFTLQRESAALRAGLRFDCPSVAASRGAILSAHVRELVGLGSALQEALPQEYGRPAAPLEVVPGRAITDATGDRLIGMIGDWLGDSTHTLRHRLLGLHELTATLGAANHTRFDDARLVELVDMLMSDMPAAVEEAATTPASPPSARQMKLLHQAVFAHCEYVSFEQASLPLHRSLALRWDQIKRARELRSEAGRVPVLGPLQGIDDARALGDVLTDADQADGRCAQSMTRYLQARINARTAFGAGYYGWDMLAGLRALLLATAVIGWLTRHIARIAGRTRYSHDDLLRAVGIVDRTAGRAPELGAASARLRVTYLSRDLGLRRLLERFALHGG